MMSQPSMDAAAGGRTIADVLHRQAAARPHDPAFVCRNQTVSWAEAASRCDGLAAHLAKVVKPGGRVAVVTRACHRYWETLFACASAGVVAVPINYRWRPSEIADVLADCGATALVADLGLLRGEDRDLVLAGIGSAVGFNGNDPRVEPYELVVSTGATAERPSDGLNVIGYTSGTTGRPKGAAITHTSGLLSALWFAALFGMGPASVFLACMPVYVYRGGAAGLAPMVVGARSIMLDFDVERVVEAIRRERVTHAVLAPVMVDRLLEYASVNETDLSSLAGIWIGGAPSSPASVVRLQALVGDIVGSVYGMTEAVGIASMRWPATGEHEPLLRSVGRPSPLLDIRLTGDDGQEVPPGTAGELHVRGETVMAGYWPAVDGGGLCDGWYPTGDIAQRDNDGHLYLVDRRADIVNSGGLNVYTIEVEQVLLRHPGVTACAVVGAPDDQFGEAVVAFIQPRPDADLQGDDVRAHCKRELAGYKCPRVLTFVDTLPRNAMGKIDKVALRRSLWPGGRHIAGD